MTTVSKQQSDQVMRSLGYIMIIALILCCPAGMSPTFADSYFFEEVDKGLLSIGGRATYIDPLDASPKWYGGAQVRLHLGQIFAIEGSVDYREKKFDSTFTRTYPVQVSGLVYLLPGGLVRLNLSDSVGPNQNFSQH